MPRGHALARAAALAGLWALAAGAFAGEPPRFEVPADCAMGSQCMVQNYVDQDPGPGAEDFTCGLLTYDGHKGVDIRLPNTAAMERGVAVLAAAPGVVLRLRDGMRDVSVREIGKAAVANREAGNSVIIDHGGGWHSQYAHLRMGSVAVKEGDSVTAGQKIGLIGLSGETEFPHVHFEVRFEERTVDPYTGPLPEARCGVVGTPLWSAGAAAAMTYRPSGLLDAGFAPASPTMEAIDRGDYAGATLSADSPALAFWVNVMGVQKGDQHRLRLLAPDGTAVAETAGASEKPRAREFRFVGRKRRGDGWAPGIYAGQYRLIRDVDGEPTVVIEATREVELR